MKKWGWDTLSVFRWDRKTHFNYCGTLKLDTILIDYVKVSHSMRCFALRDWMLRQCSSFANSPSSLSWFGDSWINIPTLKNQSEVALTPAQYSSSEMKAADKHAEISVQSATPNRILLQYACENRINHSSFGALKSFRWWFSDQQINGQFGFESHVKGNLQGITEYSWMPCSSKLSEPWSWGRLRARNWCRIG